MALPAKKRTYFMEIPNPLPGKVFFLSTCQLVELHVAMCKGLVGGVLETPRLGSVPGVEIAVQEDGGVRLHLEESALRLPGMPLAEVQEGNSLIPPERISVISNYPYEEIVISGPGTVIQGPRGRRLRSWTEAAMEVRIEIC